MRMLDAADLHIESPLRGLAHYIAAPVERLCNAPARARERLVDKAQAETRGNRGPIGIAQAGKQEHETNR